MLARKESEFEPMSDKDDTVMQSKNRGLGRGLSALFGDDEEETMAAGGNTTNRRLLPVEWLVPNASQPRRHFDEAALNDLAASIREHGVLQPILVRPVPDVANRFEIVAGERRWRASQKAQLHEVPVSIQYLTDEAVLELALIENLQREDLTPLEEAEAYQQLIQRFGHSQEKVGKAVGKSRSHVANMLRLLTLPDSVKGYLRDGSLTAGHARTLVTAPDPEALAQAMVEGRYSVREAEAMATQAKVRGGTAPANPTKEKDADTAALEREMSTLLGMPVDIKIKGKGGSLTISYASLDQLDDVLHRLSHNPGRAAYR